MKNNSDEVIKFYVYDMRLKIMSYFLHGVSNSINEYHIILKINPMLYFSIQNPTNQRPGFQNTYYLCFQNSFPL